jgi:hypothetical protein
MSGYYLVDSRTGNRASYVTLVLAREALSGWITMQRQAGEFVVEQDTGQWSDSRMTVWISDEDGHVVRLKE